MNATKHLEATVGLLQALARDRTEDVGAWALHALVLTIDSAGYDFRRFVAGTLALCSEVLHSDSSARSQQCAGNVCNALITTLGPELQVEEQLCRAFAVLLEEMQQSPVPAVQLTGLQGLQQMTVFAPKAVQVDRIMAMVSASLGSEHLQLRHAATVIVKQLAQRQPVAVVDAGLGIEKVLFRMLDEEDDVAMVSNLQDVISEFLAVLAERKPSHWLLLCNAVLSGASEKNQVRPSVPSSSWRPKRCLTMPWVR
jgi:hypothetical protein